MGHTYGDEYWRLRDLYLSGRISKEEFLRRFNDPDDYTPQDKGYNAGHGGEKPRGGPEGGTHHGLATGQATEGSRRVV